MTMVRPRVLPTPSRVVANVHAQSRLFSTTPPSRSALFNLGGLAASREGQYLSKETGIPRTEYSSNIHLIRSSEVDPFAPAPGASKHANRRSANNNNNNNSNTAAPPRQNAKTPTFTPSPFVARSRQSDTNSKPITFDALVEEHKQNKQALRNLQVRLDEVRDASRNTAQWTTAILTTLLLLSVYRSWALDGELKKMLSEKEAVVAGAGTQGSAVHATSQAVVVPEMRPVAPVVADEAPAIVDDKASHPQASGVLHWLRSAFWASGGR